MRITCSMVLVLFMSCQQSTKYPHAIKDFSAALQPELTTLVNSGVVDGEGSYRIIEKISTKDLYKLGKAEHPILRLEALTSLFYNDSLDNFDLMMSHLDDTANVTIYQGGCWARQPYRMSTVSDELLNRYVWADSAQRELTIDKVLMEHNYLSAAYSILTRIEPREKYYKVIREMASRNRSYYDIEKALFALARFKKREDVPLIREKISENMYEAEYLTFKIIEMIRDTSFFTIMKKLSKSYLWEKICEPNGIRYIEYSHPGVPYIRALASFQSDSASKIFGFFLDWMKMKRCQKTEVTEHDIYSALKEYMCPAYKKYEKEIKQFFENEARRYAGYPVIEAIEPDESVPNFKEREKVRWWD